MCDTAKIECALSHTTVQDNARQTCLWCTTEYNLSILLVEYFNGQGRKGGKNKIFQPSANPLLHTVIATTE